MTQEDKQLLLKDLSARLPYYPKCEMIDKLRVINNEPSYSYTEYLFPRHLELFYFHNNFIIKPYLRPMSSMTEEEKIDYQAFFNYDGVEYPEEYIDWLNAHHFDYRGLIEKGLAISVSEYNNPYKE